MEIKITKKQNLYEQHNDMVSNYYYLIHGRIISDDGTRFKKFKFVVHFDGYDLYDAEMDKKEYLDELIGCCFIDYINSYNDCNYFFKICNESIEKYNKLVKYF